MCGGIVALVILGFWAGADTFFDIIKNDIFTEMPNYFFQSIIAMIAIGYYLYLILDFCRHKVNPPELDGFALKQDILTRGMFFKKKFFWNIIAFTWFVGVMVLKNMVSQASVWYDLCGWLILCSFLPIFMIIRDLKADRVSARAENWHEQINVPSKQEISQSNFDVYTTQQMNKDVRRLEKDFRKQKKDITEEDKKEIKVKQDTYIQKFWLTPEFWCFGLARFCFGASNTATLDLLDEMSLGHRSTALQAADVIQCYELVGLLLSGFFLNYLRDYFNPLNLTNGCLVLNVLLQLLALNLVNNQNWYF